MYVHVALHDCNTHRTVLTVFPLILQKIIAHKLLFTLWVEVPFYFNKWTWSTKRRVRIGGERLAYSFEPEIKQKDD